MFGFKKRPPSSNATAICKPKHANLVAQSAADLLATEHRTSLISKMRRTSSVTDKVFQDHYYYAITRAAEYAQAFPASANHHHSYEGGLLDHMLEVTFNATRVCRGFIMPPNAQPEDITKHEEKWRYAAFIAALSHDLGKLIADIETVYRPAKSKDNSYTNWHAWYGPMPEGSDYIYRFKPKNGTSYRGLHEQLSATILPYLITPSASSWLRSDQALMSQLMATITQSANFSGVIGEIVKKSDHASTGAALGADTGTSAATIPNHQKIMTALKLLTTNGTFKRNNPGSALWVGEHVTWYSFKPVLQAVRQHLVEEGHKGIPQSEHRLVQILNEHKHTLLPTSGDDTWQGVVTDTKRKGWTVKLSFFVVPNEAIWAGGTPALFDGEITPSDGKGKPLDPTTLPIDLKPNSINSESRSNDSPTPEDAPVNVTVTREPDTQAPSPDSTASPKAKPKAKAAPKPSKKPKETTGNINSSEQEITKGKYSASGSDLTAESRFYEWVARNLFYGKLRYNEPEAPIHILGDYVVLVTPSIFNAYLKHSDNRSEIVALGKNEAERLKALQKEVRLLNAHKRASDGTDFHTVQIAGPKNNGAFNAILIDRRKLPQLNHIKANPALSIA